MPDPNIAPAMAEIRAVLLRHGFAGFFVVSSETHVEHEYTLNAPWSCARIEGDQLRLRAKREDYPSQEAQKHALEVTLGFLQSLQKVCGQTFLDMDKIAKMVASHGLKAEDHGHREGVQVPPGEEV